MLDSVEDGLGRLQQQLLQLDRELRQTRADFIHTHSIYPGLYSGFSSAMAPRPKRIMSFHNLGYSSYPATTLKQKALKTTTGSPKLVPWPVANGAGRIRLKVAPPSVDTETPE